MCSVKISLCAPLCVCAALVVTKCLVFSIFCAAIFFCVVKSQLPLNVLDPLYCCHPPLLHSPADVRQGRLVVPAVYLLPFRGFTWEATAQINSLNSHCSVGTSFSLPHLLAHSLPASPPYVLCSFSTSFPVFVHFFFFPGLSASLASRRFVHFSLAFLFFSFKLMRSTGLTLQQSTSTMGKHAWCCKT